MLLGKSWGGAHLADVGRGGEESGRRGTERPRGTTSAEVRIDLPKFIYIET